MGSLDMLVLVAMATQWYTPESVAVNGSMMSELSVTIANGLVDVMVTF